MSYLRRALFFVSGLLTLLKSICCPSLMEQNQDKKLRKMFDEPLVEKISADLAEELLSLNVYKFSQGPYNYFILDDFGVENIEHKLIRIPENPQTYLYDGRDSLDLEKNFVEIQSFKILDRTFTKRFYYLEDYEFDFISRKALSINEDENRDTFNKILALFQLEFEYKDKLIDNETKHKSSKVLRSYPSDFFSVNDQALLDTYLQTANIHTLNTLNSSAGDNSKHITMDDPIVTLIPKGAFAVIDTKKIAGKEWGYYLKTTPYDYYLIKAEVFLFDICGTYPSNNNFFGMEITPVINAVYFYNSATDIVYYVQDNNLCFYNPSYAATITYVDEYGWFYNDYDETEYYVTKQHQPNPGETGYNSLNDHGCFFADQYIVLEGVKPVDLVEQTYTEFKLFLDSLSVVLSFLPFDYKTAVTINSAVLLANFINDSIFNIYSNYLSSTDILYHNKETNMYSLEHVKDNSCSEADYPEHMSDKFSGFSYEEANLLFKNNKHHIMFYNSIAKSSKITSDYRMLFSQKAKLGLCRETFNGLSNVDTIDCDISYLWSPLYQTSNISNQDLGKRTHVSLSATGKKFRYEKFLKPGNYQLQLDSLPKKSTVTYSHGKGFYTDFDKKALFIETDHISVEDKLPIKVSDTNYFSISEPTTFYFEIQPSQDNSIVDFSFDYVLLKCEEPVTTNEYLNSYEIINLNFQYHDDAQLVQFVPRVSALYTFNSSGSAYGNKFSIFDSQGRPLMEGRDCHGGFLDIYLLSKDKTYYLVYKANYSNSTLNLKIYKNRYIEPYPSPYTSFYRYQKFDSSINCFLFRPVVDVRYVISSTLNSQRIVIYDLNGNKLAQNSNSGELTFDFTKNKTYFIYVDYYLRDFNFLLFASLKLEVR